MKQYVVGFGFTQSGTVWLVRKNKRGVPVGWNGLGGNIEGKESPAAAMAREWREETSVEWPADAREVATLEGASFRVYFFAARLPRSAYPLVVQNDVGEQVDSFNRNELPQDVVPNLRWLIPMAIEALDNPGRGAPYFVRESEGAPV